MSRRAYIQQLNQIPVHIKTPDFSATMLWWGAIEEEWWRNYLHVHSFFEVCYAFAGSGSFIIDNQRYSVQSGDIFIARPGQYHEIISSIDDPLGIFHWSYTLSINDISSDTSNLLHMFVQSSACISQKSSYIPMVFELLIDEAIRQESGFTQVVVALTTKLLLETARSIINIPASPPPENDFPSRVASNIIHYMKDNIQQPMQIRDIAAQVHMSERHASRLFRQVTGKTINTYLTELRLEKASQLLLKDDMPIHEVAWNSGYPDTRYFSTLFRKHFGMTPSEFRHQHGTKFAK